jgi:hypothetical protein
LIGSIRASSLGNGNVLACSNGIIYEYTPSGQLLQTISVPLQGGTEYARDLVVDPSGKLLVYNGTFTPQLSTYDPVTNSWTNQTFPEWSTVNNTSYGGISSNGRYVYVTDDITNGAAACGIVRFDRTAGTAQRFDSGVETIDLNLGLDGLLYALNGTGSPDGQSVSVFNPITMALIRTVSLSNVSIANRGIAADIDGSMFIATWGGSLVHVSPSGGILGSIPLPTANTQLPADNNFDVDLRPDGAILVGQRFGSVIETDRSLSSPTAFLVPTQESVFVAFSDPVPEPASIVLIGGALWLLAIAWKKKDGATKAFKGAKTNVWIAICTIGTAALLGSHSSAARCDTVTIRTDDTWRTSRGTTPVTTDWISNLNYDDSDTAGWRNAFKSPSGDNI